MNDFKTDVTRKNSPRKPAPMPQDALKRVLLYNPQNGVFTWPKTGKPAGSIAASGYVEIGLGYARYRAHRLAWLYTFGDWPDSDLDHINGIRSDNRIANLRVVTRAQNCQNRGANKSNPSGAKGVSKHQGKWLARIKHEGVTKYLGVYDTVEEAAFAYRFAAVQIQSHGSAA
jgi:hypothetical protein